ncbi:MAG: oxygen-dependent coproporphyrinogen oxidase [Planctomycetota bacterium]|nr:oxygen-dependent coproporphyrinogen oxidase [Planctomycetota bacterium]
MEPADIAPVRSYLLDLQERICAALEAVDGEARFDRRELPGERGGLARPQVLSGGTVIEHAAVNFSHTSGARLPVAATVRKPELTGGAFEAVSVSLIVHPRNPYAPTTHANLRLFSALTTEGKPVWWFGGGFDLTPYYGFDEDAVHWHKAARSACEPFGEDVHARLKSACDEYFFLPHRGEARGIGGIFFDDWTQDGFERSFDFLRSVGDHFLPAYRPIVERRLETPYGARERDFQLYRRGRYVEFNLVYDRGTRFGLQAGGRTESILASLPPEVNWRYDWTPEAGTPEAELYERFLPPRDWLTDA